MSWETEEPLPTWQFKPLILLLKQLHFAKVPRCLADQELKCHCSPPAHVPSTRQTAWSLILSLWLQPCYIQCDSTRHVPDYTAARGSVWEVGKQRAKPTLQNGKRGALREVWLKEILLPLSVTLLASSSPGTSLLPAPPPPAYLALALCRPLHPLVPLTEFAGDGGKESFLLN